MSLVAFLIEGIAAMAVEIDRHAYGAWLIAIISLIGLALALRGYFTPNDGISFTPGALLVVISTALILAASVLLGLTGLPVWVNVVLDVLLLLGLLGTALAAWFLQTYLLVALMFVGVIAWIVHVISPRLFHAVSTNVGAGT
jgi:hypothetical protein